MFKWVQPIARHLAVDHAPDPEQVAIFQLLASADEGQLRKNATVVVTQLKKNAKPR